METEMTFNRRQFLAAGAVLGATSALAQPTSPLPFLINMQSDPLLPKATGKRVVVCGGGWGGISAAKHLKQNWTRRSMLSCSSATRSSSPAR
jgi:hypothetical protein